MTEDIKVSICCLVYNHEKYLRKCLDGFIMQKTNFAYEILIHDDASTDGSVDIIKEYVTKYPDIIKPIYQTENQYSKGVKISWQYQFPRAKGKYIALCEGDDYWCDENKLQVQYEEMEAHPEAVFCSHKVRCITEQGEYRGDFYPRIRIKDYEINPDRMMEIMKEHRYPFQTSSYFYKAELFTCLGINNMPDFMRLGGDLMILLYLISKGNFIYIDKIMSCYRCNSSGSWTERNNNKENQIELTQNTIAAYLLFDIYTKQKYSYIIKQIIEQQVFYIFQINNDYKMMCKLRYHWILRQLPVKQQIYYQFCSICPAVEKFYKRIKGRGL